MMWKLYADASKGVAIRSSPSRIRAALQPFRLAPDYGEEQLWVGPVRYEDLLAVRMRVRMLERFFCKHRAFAAEREFRLAISLRTAEENAVAVPDLGIEVAVNIGELIEHIVLGPELSEEERGRVVQCAEQAGLGDRIALSGLLGRPRYV